MAHKIGTAVCGSTYGGVRGRKMKVEENYLQFNVLR